MNDAKRILECLRCEYYCRCEETVQEPEDNPDGSCKTKEEFEKNRISSWYETILSEL